MKDEAEGILNIATPKRGAVSEETTDDQTLVGKVIKEEGERIILHQKNSSQLCSRAVHERGEPNNLR